MPVSYGLMLLARSIAQDRNGVMSHAPHAPLVAIAIPPSLLAWQPGGLMGFISASLSPVRYGTLAGRVLTFASALNLDVASRDNGRR